jgi:hypothetical protein
MNRLAHVRSQSTLFHYVASPYLKLTFDGLVKNMLLGPLSVPCWLLSPNLQVSRNISNRGNQQCARVWIELRFNGSGKNLTFQYVSMIIEVGEEYWIDV